MIFKTENICSVMMNVSSVYFQFAGKILSVLFREFSVRISVVFVFNSYSINAVAYDDVILFDYCIFKITRTDNRIPWTLIKERFTYGVITGIVGYPENFR